MRTIFFTVVLALALCGCAHVAQHVTAPSTAQFDASAQRLISSVAASKLAVAAAKVSIDTARKAHQTELARIQAIEPKVSELLRVAPPDLRPQVAALDDDVTALHGDHELTAHAIDDAIAEQVKAGQRLDEANAAKNEAERFHSEYVAAVDAMAVRAQKSEDGWAKDSKELQGYRLHWFLGWVMLIGSVAALILFWFLKFAGRLAFKSFSL